MDHPGILLEIPLVCRRTDPTQMTPVSEDQRPPIQGSIKIDGCLQNLTYPVPTHLSLTRSKSQKSHMTQNIIIQMSFFLLCKEYSKIKSSDCFRVHISLFDIHLQQTVTARCKLFVICYIKLCSLYVRAMAGTERAKS